MHFNQESMFRIFVLFHTLSLLNLSLAAETVIDWSLPTDGQPFDQMFVFAGDSIRFEYPGDTINVLLYPSGTCDGTDWELIGDAGEGSVTYTFTEDQIDSVITFSTGYMNYCALGMILDVVVMASVSSETPSDTPSLVPSSIPVPALPADPASVAPSVIDRADDTLPTDIVPYVGDETVYDWALPEDLQPFEQISVFAGTTIRFNYPGESINVLRNPSGTCDDTGAELIGEAGEGSATYTFDDSQIDSIITFATNYWNYCNFGMILNVLVLQPPPSSSPSQSPSAVSSETPTGRPTLSATVPVPTNPPTALVNLVVDDAVVAWSLPDDGQPYDSISVYARGTIRFEYPGSNINVLRYPSGTCDDSTGSEIVGEAGQGNATYTFTEDQIDTVVTFATNYWNYCSFGMIIRVLVIEPPPSAAPSETPSKMPSLSPAVPTVVPVPSVAPTPLSPVDQPTRPTDPPVLDPTDTMAPTIAKKTRPPTPEPAGPATSSAAKFAFQRTLLVSLASILVFIAY